MKRIYIIILYLTIFCGINNAQNNDDILKEMKGIIIPDTIPTTYKLKLQKYLFKEKYNFEGELINEYLLPEVPVYGPLKFKNKRQIEKYNRLVYNIKVVLPIAQLANSLIKETYETLETLPDKKSKDRHNKAVERDVKKQFTPMMKKLTYSQGKLLIKLIDRECNQTSYDIVKAFLGPAKATFYQIFAWTFRASLKKEYDPENDDKLIERVVVQIEAGLL